MTIYTDMRERALAEFDQMAAEKEREIRLTMKAAGATQIEIEAHLEACRPSLAEQRATVGRIVTVALMKAGLRIEGANDNVRA